MIPANELARAVQSGDQELIAQVAFYLDLVQVTDAATNFKSFVQLFWPHVATTPLVEGFYLDAICDHLQHLPELKRLIISIPPRHGKSSICSILYPAWLWTHRPETKFICSSYSLKDLSTRDSIACRSVIESPIYKRNWGEVYSLATDQNTRSRYTNSRLGIRLATSVESANIGEGCDVLIADDVNNVTRIASDTERLSVITWWCTVMSSRLNPGGMNCKVVIQQRCHENDITGYILAQDDAADWTHLVLPWHYDPSRRTTTSIGWTDPRTIPGEPLSTLYSHQEIEERKGGNGLGPTGFACQFDQRPAPAGGSMFLERYFQTYHEEQDTYVLGDTRIKKDDCRIFITTDLAISLKLTADFTVAQVWAVTPNNHLLLLDEWRERVEGPDAIKQFQFLASKYQPDAVWVEDVAYQRIVIQLLRQAGVPTRPLQHLGLDKRARAQRSLVKAECGQIWLPRAAWVKEWLAEVTTFPVATHDDRVDCLAWAGIVSGKYPTTDVKPIPPAVDKATRLAQREAALMTGD